MMKNYIIKTHNIEKSFKIKNQAPNKVLNNISVDIETGSFTALTGPSGVGKSTLLYILGTLDVADSGSLEFYKDGKIINPKMLSSDKLAMLRNKFIGFVFQFHHLLPEFTALENIMLPGLIAGMRKSVAEKAAMELTKRVGISARNNHKPSELSGGEQQRAAIARALINSPKLVLADEPTGNLDSKNAESVISLISDLQKEYELTFVVATHSNEVANSAGIVHQMLDGKILPQN